MADSDHHILQPVTSRVEVEDVARADDADADAFGKLHEGAVARTVAEDKVVLQLDEDVVGAEPVDEAAEGGFGLGGAVRLDESGNEAVSAAGEEDEAGGVVGQFVDR